MQLQASTHTIEKIQWQNPVCAQSKVKFKKQTEQALHGMKQLHMHRREQNWWRQLQLQWRTEKSAGKTNYENATEVDRSQSKSVAAPALTVQGISTKCSGSQ
jgi:hypothetical protein